jgi:hypothetical protein
VSRFPASDEVVVLLIVHLCEVAHEERGSWGTTEGTEGRAVLSDEQTDETRESIEEKKRKDDDE